MSAPESRPDTTHSGLRKDSVLYTAVAQFRAQWRKESIPSEYSVYHHFGLINAVGASCVLLTGWLAGGPRFIFTNPASLVMVFLAFCVCNYFEYYAHRYQLHAPFVHTRHSHTHHRYFTGQSHDGCTRHRESLRRMEEALGWSTEWSRGWIRRSTYTQLFTPRLLAVAFCSIDRVMEFDEFRDAHTIFFPPRAPYFLVALITILSLLPVLITGVKPGMAFACTLAAYYLTYEWLRQFCAHSQTARRLTLAHVMADELLPRMC
jgi:hypothetical protein